MSLSTFQVLLSGISIPPVSQRDGLHARAVKRRSSRYDGCPAKCHWSCFLLARFCRVLSKSLLEGCHLDFQRAPNGLSWIKCQGSGVHLAELETADFLLNSGTSTIRTRGFLPGGAAEGHG